MPTRIIREGIITSEPINSVSERAELFYRRLMSVADDYGRYFAHPSILRGACYPLRLDTVSESDVKRMLNECLEAGIIVLYGGGKYLLMPKFGQQTRSKSKFPEPSDNDLLIKCESIDKQMCSLVGVGDVGEYVVGDGIEDGVFSPQCRSLLRVLNEASGRQFRECSASLDPIQARLKEKDVDFDGCKKMIIRQCSIWKNDPKMSEYMRPTTLFRKSNFDAYYSARELPAPNGKAEQKQLHEIIEVKSL